VSLVFRLCTADVVWLAMYSYAVDSMCICDNVGVQFQRRLVLLMFVICSLVIKWLELIGVHGGLELDGILVAVFVVVVWVYDM